MRSGDEAERRKRMRDAYKAKPRRTGRLITYLEGMLCDVNNLSAIELLAMAHAKRPIIRAHKHMAHEIARDTGYSPEERIFLLNLHRSEAMKHYKRMQVLLIGARVKNGEESHRKPFRVNGFRLCSLCYYSESNKRSQKWHEAGDRCAACGYTSEMGEGGWGI